MCIFISYGIETLDNDCSYIIKPYLEFSIFFLLCPVVQTQYDECKTDVNVKKYANSCKRQEEDV